MMLSTRQLREGIALPHSEIENILLLRAENYLKRGLSTKEKRSFLEDLFEQSAGSYPDRLVLGVLSEITKKRFEEVRHVAKEYFRSSREFKKAVANLEADGFRMGLDFKSYEGLAEKYPHALYWRVSADNYDRIKAHDSSLVATLAGTLRAFIPCLESLRGEEIYEVLKRAVTGTTSLMTGMGIIKRAYGQNKKGLEKYLINLHLTGSDLGLSGGKTKRGWGSENSVRRKDISVSPSDYMSYDKQHFWPSSIREPLEQSVDDSRQEEESLIQSDKARKLKKKLRS